MAQGLDCKICVEILLNQEAPPNDRLAAAESLMHCSRYGPTKDALFQVMCDETEEDWLREECAGSLGSVFAEIGIDYEMLLKTPDKYLRELVGDFRLCGLALDGSRLGEKENEIRVKIGDIVQIT
jgi:hypothetical protein